MKHGLKIVEMPTTGCDIAPAIALMRSKGLRITDNRIAILKLIADGPEPMTAEDVCAATGIERGTTHRCLNSMARVGVLLTIRTNEVARRYKWSDNMPHPQTRQSTREQEELMLATAVSGLSKVVALFLQNEGTLFEGEWPSAGITDAEAAAIWRAVAMHSRKP